MRNETKLNILLYSSGIFWIVFGFCVLASAQCEGVDPNFRTIKSLQEIKHQLERHLAPGAVPADELAPLLRQKALEYEVDPDIVVRIVLQESRGLEKAINRRSHDYGLMQINRRTARSYQVGPKCLMNWKCNLEAGIRILSEVPHGDVCRYNIGSGILQGEVMKKCTRYMQQLAQFN